MHLGLHSSRLLAPLLAALVAMAPAIARGERVASRAKGRVINLVKAPAERQRLLRFVEKKLARIYEASEDRISSSGTRLQYFHGNRELTQRWDLLSSAVLDTLRQVPQVKLGMVTERPKDAYSSITRRTPLFELRDGEKELGQLALTRSLDLMKSPLYRKELKTEIAFDS